MNQDKLKQLFNDISISCVKTDDIDDNRCYYEKDVVKVITEEMFFELLKKLNLFPKIKQCNDKDVLSGDKHCFICTGESCNHYY